MPSALKSYKKEFDYSYALGLAATFELVKQRSGDVTAVFVSSKATMTSTFIAMLDYCRKNNIKVTTDDRVIEKLSIAENTYVIGVFKKYASNLAPQKNHVVLVNPSDMGNLGSIIRAMVGFDSLNLAIIRPGVDVFEPKVVRATMGALFLLNFEYFESFADYKLKFPAHSLYPFMTDGLQDLRNTTFTTPYSLVFGNEGAGLDQQFLHVGTSVKIAYENKIDSLNLSTAVGIALYEAYVRN